MALESLQFAAGICRDRGVRIHEVLLRASWEGRRVHDLGCALLLVRKTSSVYISSELF